MNKVLEYFKNNDIKKIEKDDITVYGWQNPYEHTLISSVSNYLFEDLDITENIVCVNEDNRPGVVKPNKYITVHDTGDSSPLHTAKFWSEAVFNRSWEMSPGEVAKYLCSYQYVVDNEGIYHNVPDNEVAYHAGCGTKFDYNLYDTGIKGTNVNPIVTISADGYYKVDGVKSNIIAPRYKIVKDGEVVVDRVAINSEINDQGVLCKLIDGTYFIGETYFNTTYKKICNHGGNNNSIGIESCITDGTDIFYTWQKTAKLVAYLMDKENLTINDVVQHHYFSGKNCPQTMRENGKWERVRKLIQFEYDILMFKKEGYVIELIIQDNRVLPNGRVKSYDGGIINYSIRTKYQGMIDELNIKLGE